MPEQKPAAEEEKKVGRRRIDLSVAQVAASALAAVVGAVLASELGVYGTILGAAVVSAGATTGSAVFQHLFRRTGEQLREAVERTGPGVEVNALRQVPAGSVSGAAFESVSAAGRPRLPSEWSEPRTARARRRWTWRTLAAVSGLVFVLAMTPIVAFELATGQPVSATVQGESGSGTSFGGTVAPKPSGPSGRSDRPDPWSPSKPADVPAGAPPDGSGGAGAPSGTASPGGGGSSPSAGRGDAASPSAAPSASPSAGGGGDSSPSAGGSSTPTAGPTGGVPPSGGASKPAGGSTPQPPAPSAAATPAAPAPTGG
ncbi:hypothetical protein ACF9IK_11300 [Kitasatospora hibisci]|uniref:hypothetical protein n=1 Tax=Kitasatospora hibisci TaxID=3369522 RepID=UPI003754F0DE